MVPNGGYRWWYLDALSDDGACGVTIIGFVGSVFSPYYARARRRVDADPENHCALNVVLHGRGLERWSMTERGCAAVLRRSEAFSIGPSAMRWERGSLIVDIDEITVPLPRRLRGEVRLTPAAICKHEVRLDPAGHHCWRPVAPVARVDVQMEKPGLSWSGLGYHDMNWGSVPLEDSFSSWMWSRSATRDGAHIIYDTVSREGERSAFALHIDGNGNVCEVELPQAVQLETGFWRMPRHARSEGTASVIATLADSPFYIRSLIRTRINDKDVNSVHESLSLEKFCKPLVQAMLPFRMPRRVG